MSRWKLTPHMLVAALILLLVGLLLGCDIGTVQVDLGVATATAAVAATATPEVILTATLTPEPVATATEAPTATEEPTPTGETLKATAKPPTPEPTTEPPTAIATMMEITLAADGSGDFATLEEAVEAAADGATITLGPGSYELESMLEINKPLRLVGQAMDDTVIISEAEGAVVHFTGSGLFAAENLTFRHKGKAIANVVEVAGGEVDFRRCGFTGAVWDKQKAMGGIGLLIYGDTQGEVRECWIHDNGLYGISVGDQAQPTLDGNTADHNDGGGIGYWGSAGGVANNNWCSDNSHNGILVNDKATPILTGNTCQNNTDNGISYWGNSGGEARGNECSGNGYHGISVSERAQPLLEGNTCNSNSDSGIAYFDNSGGTARRNECSNNSRHGIAVTEKAKPILEDNTVSDNGDSGIAYFDSAGGSASGNHCSGNVSYGMYVARTANPRLADNDCEGSTFAEPTPKSVAGPRFNPDGEPWCFDAPEPVIDRDWQVSAPREAVNIGESVEIGLRNKFGESNEFYAIWVRVIAPDGSEAGVTTEVSADEWTMLMYPDDFPDAGPMGNGIYTVIWEIADQGFVACDGFEVVGGASSMGGGAGGMDILFDAIRGDVYSTLPEATSYVPWMPLTVPLWPGRKKTLPNWQARRTASSWHWSIRLCCSRGSACKSYSSSGSPCGRRIRLQRWSRMQRSTPSW